MGSNVIESCAQLASFVFSVVPSERKTCVDLEVSARKRRVRSHGFEEEPPRAAVAVFKPAKRANIEQDDGLLGFDHMLRRKSRKLLIEPRLLHQKLLPIGEKLRF